MLLKKRSSFYCFSPPVMLATFLIEIGLLLFVITKYGTRTVRNRLAAGMLLCLALFQLAEYNVCGRFNIDALGWSRLGFVAITLLPSLGVHLLYTLANKKSRLVVPLAYLSGLTFVYIFVFSASAFNSHVCAGNYAIFQLRNHLGGSYFAYYYFWLLFSLGRGWQFIATVTARRKKAIRYLLSGYLFFLIPTTVANMVKPETMDGIPSIMCGFAVIYAIVLVFGILPLKLAKAETID